MPAARFAIVVYAILGKDTTSFSRFQAKHADETAPYDQTSSVGRWFCLLFMVWLTLLVNEGRAQVYRLQVNFVSCEQSQCRQQRGFGTCVAVGSFRPQRPLFLTAAHCVPHATRDLQIRIDQRWYRAHLLGRLENPSDLALLGVVADDMIVRPVSISRQYRPREVVTVMAFPEGRDRRIRRAQLERSRFLNFPVVFDQPSLPGESGGAVLNEQGELVGVISATAPAARPTITLCNGPAEIRELFQQTFRSNPPLINHERPPQSVLEQPSAAEIPELTPAVPEPASPTRFQCPCSQRNCRCRTYEPGLDARLKQLRLELLALKQQLPVPPTEQQRREQQAFWNRIELRLSRLETQRTVVEILSPDGEVLDRASYKLGEPIQLRLIPKRE